MSSLAPRMILAVDAAHRAVREKDGARTVRPGDWRLFAEVRTVAENTRQHARPAVAELAREAIRAACTRAKTARTQNAERRTLNVEVFFVLGSAFRVLRSAFCVLRSAFFILRSHAVNCRRKLRRFQEKVDSKSGFCVLQGKGERVVMSRLLKHPTKEGIWTGVYLS